MRGRATLSLDLLPAGFLGEVEGICELDLVLALHVVSGPRHVVVQDRLAVDEEILGPALPHDERIVVGVDEVLREPGDEAEEHLDGCGTEHRQELLRDDVLVIYDMNRLGVHPRRHLRRS